MTEILRQQIQVYGVTAYMPYKKDRCLLTGLDIPKMR
jgi:hypothetical protein